VSGSLSFVSFVCASWTEELSLQVEDEEEDDVTDQTSDEDEDED